MPNAKTLLNMKEKIKDDKIKVHKLQGKKETELKTLKGEKCRGIKRAKKLLKTLEKELQKDTDIFNKQVNKLSGRVK